MSKLHAPLLLFCLAAVFGCRESSMPGRVSPRSAVESVSRFGVQFSGDYRLDAMSPYQLMIIDPDVSTAGEADSLSRRGALPVAYVNIGEAESYRWFFNDILPEWRLGANPNWPGHFYIDVTQRGWQRLLIERVLPAVFEKGFTGVFLDMIDVASPALYPRLRPGVLAIIREIRTAYPDKILLINNGTFLAGDASDLIDGIVVESTFTTYDFASKAYVPVKKEDSDARCAELDSLKAAYGIRFFAIDYAAPGDSAAALYARREARRHGLLSFVSTIELNSLPASSSHDRKE